MGDVSRERQWFSAVARALGVEIDLAECRLVLVRVCNTEARKRSLSDFITNIIQSGGAPARDFESLRGRLNFAEGQIFGRGANSRMRALAKACMRAGFVKVSGDLLEALLYLRDRVVLDEPRHTAKRVCFHLYIEGFIYEVEVCAAVQGICKLCTSLRSADMCSFVTMKLLWQP